MFSKVLIANRGIIQLNCIRAVREIGAKAAVAYVPPDRESIGVWMADEAHEISTPDLAAAYYDAQQIADLAERIGADAVHPGYGFLAQNADFARMLSQRGICLIASDLENRFGVITDKPSTKAAAAKLKLQVIPGSAACATFAETQAAAKSLGFPVIVKAITGSGGRALRVAMKAQELKSAYDYVVSRASRLHLANTTVFVEHYLAGARHIEFPVIRDQVGNTVVLPEIECSIQRRFQKLLLETPSPLQDRALVRHIATASRRLIEKLELVGFCSVEFLVQDGEAYFLEINGYIQPAQLATHAITGIDLLKEQIRVIAGEPLSFGQEDISARGHAISVAVNAEDPEADFAPSPGLLKRLQLITGVGMLAYTALRAGDTITSYYEPLISQLVVTDRDRAETIEKLNVALSCVMIEGVKTNLPFLRAITASPDFEAMRMTISYINEKAHLKELLESMSTEEELDIASLLAIVTLANDKNSQQFLDAAQRESNYSIWNFASRWINRNKLGY